MTSTDHMYAPVIFWYRFQENNNLLKIYTSFKIQFKKFTFETTSKRRANVTNMRIW